jgi:hypothetical protein
MYATIIDIEIVKKDNALHNQSMQCPQWHAQEILERHALESRGSQYPAPVTSIHSVGKHDHYVTFTYPDGSKKVFTGKEWK